MNGNEHAEVMLMLGRLEGKLDGVLSEAVKTNGRVTRLEKDIAEMKVSDGIQNTKLGFIGTIAGMVGGIIAAFVKSLL